MASYTERFTEAWQLLGKIYGVNASTEQNTGYLSCAGMNRVVVIIHPLSLGGALDVDVEEARDSTGTGLQAFDSNGHDITVAQTDTKPSVIEITGDEFTTNYDYLNIEITPAGASYFVCEVWGLTSHPPASTTNLDSVTD